jgi:peroxiredoxin (alkyl hydroperoxide reductase subunit C)
MKKVMLSVALVFVMTQLWSQGISSDATSTSQENMNRNFRIPLIGESAPSFMAESTTGTINFPVDFGRNWKILFSHPQDFTPVCTSEILELAHLQEKFKDLGVKLVVVSTDPLDMHFQWKKAMEKLEYKDRSGVKIKFPIVDDEKLAVSMKYGMIHAPTNTTKDVRGVFIIDPDDVVRAIYFYPLEIGRSTDELVRAITALQTTYKKDLMTPADWRAGNDLLVPFVPQIDPGNPDAIPEGYYKLAWFMWYKRAGN